MRFLGIDYGTKRIGIAVGDDELSVAVPCPPLFCARGGLWERLGATIRERQIDCLVVGHPLGEDGRPTAWTGRVEAFVGRLRDHFPLPVYLADERLTTYQAKGDRPMGGKVARAGHFRVERRSGIIDSRAATLLLQDFLNERKANGGHG
jgi:putative Holliday junction resolvase